MLILYSHDDNVIDVFLMLMPFANLLIASTLNLNSKLRMSEEWENEENIWCLRKNELANDKRKSQVPYK